MKTLTFNENQCVKINNDEEFKVILMDKNSCLKPKRYIKEQVDYVRSKVSFKVPIS